MRSAHAAHHHILWLLLFLVDCWTADSFSGLYIIWNGIVNICPSIAAMNSGMLLINWLVSQIVISKRSISVILHFIQLEKKNVTYLLDLFPVAVRSLIPIRKNAFEMIMFRKEKIFNQNLTCTPFYVWKFSVLCHSNGYLCYYIKFGATVSNEIQLHCCNLRMQTDWILVCLNKRTIVCKDGQTDKFGSVCLL